MRAVAHIIFPDPTSAFRLEARFGADSLQRIVRIGDLLGFIPAGLLF